MTKLFSAKDFTATEFETADAKVKFCEQFVKFVKNDFAKESFPKWFYQRLSMTFGHIAHYDQNGFYETFFTNTDHIRYFIQKTLNYPCYGSPAFTYCDAEKVIQTWLRDNKIMEKWQKKLQQETEAKERKEFERLSNKYGETK